MCHQRQGKARLVIESLGSLIEPNFRLKRYQLLSVLIAMALFVHGPVRSHCLYYQWNRVVHVVHVYVVVHVLYIQHSMEKEGIIFP